MVSPVEATMANYVSEHGDDILLVWNQLMLHTFPLDKRLRLKDSSDVSQGMFMVVGDPFNFGVNRGSGFATVWLPLTRTNGELYVLQIQLRTAPGTPSIEADLKAGPKCMFAYPSAQEAASYHNGAYIATLWRHPRPGVTIDPINVCFGGRLCSELRSKMQLVGKVKLWHRRAAERAYAPGQTGYLTAKRSWDSFVGNSTDDGHDS